MATRWLLLATSQRIGKVGLSEGSSLRAVRSLDRSRRNARDLHTSVKEALDECGWRIDQLGGVAVDVGPGSYTGLRVAVMAAKVLAYARRIPLVAIEAFRIVAEQQPASAEPLAVIADAEPPCIYVQPWRWGGSWQPAEPIAVVDRAEWQRSVTAGARAIGPGLPLLDPELELIRLPYEPTAEGELAAVARIAQSMADAGQFADPYSLEPLYLRASSAERNWKPKA